LTAEYFPTSRNAHQDRRSLHRNIGNPLGKAYQIEKGHLYFVDEFSGTFFNDKGAGSLFDKAGVKCPGFYDIDLSNKKGKAGGYCTISTGVGDDAYLSFKCEGDTINCTGPFEYTGGLGKYAAISGSNYKFSAARDFRGGQ
jgi:hypothetical protein